MPREQLYLDHLDLIEEVIRFTTRRHRCSADEAAEFAGVARLALVENDYAVLAAFEGRSSLATYLSVVLQRQFLEFRIRKWGKWRPSAEAKRLGPVAIRLESLLVRDRLDLPTAVATLLQADPTLTPAAIDDLAARLPPRTLRRFEDAEALAEMPSDEASPETQLLEDEAASRRRRATAALGASLRELPAQDRLVLRLRFAEGRRVVEIAQVLGLEARPLYRRIEALVKSLRQALAARGVHGDDLGWPARADAEVAERPRAASGSEAAESRLRGRLGEMRP